MSKELAKEQELQEVQVSAELAQELRKLRAISDALPQNVTCRIWKSSIIGAAIAITTGMILYGTSGCDLNTWLCLPRGLYLAVRSRPPWVLVSGIAVAPSLILLWSWKTKQRKAEIRSQLLSVEALNAQVKETKEANRLAQKQVDVQIEISQKQIETNHSEQLATRFSKACEMLTDSKEESGVKAIGAIHALLSVAHSSDKSYALSVGVTLNRMLRNEALPFETTPGAESKNVSTEPQVTALVQELLLALGRLTRLNPAADFDLSDLNLAGAKLLHSDFRAANFASCNLCRSWLSGTDLTLARLFDADLTGAKCSGTVLEHVHLIGARLDYAILDYAKAGKSYLGRASLVRAQLIGTDFTGSFLNEVDFEEAIFHETNLRGANLLGARNLTQEQLENAYGDTKTKLPSGLKIETTEEPEKALDGAGEPPSVRSKEAEGDRQSEPLVI